MASTSRVCTLGAVRGSASASDASAATRGAVSPPANRNGTSARACGSHGAPTLLASAPTQRNASAAPGSRAGAGLSPLFVGGAVAAAANAFSIAAHVSRVAAAISGRYRSRGFWWSARRRFSLEPNACTLEPDAMRASDPPNPNPENEPARRWVFTDGFARFVSRALSSRSRAEPREGEPDRGYASCA